MKLRSRLLTIAALLAVSIGLLAPVRASALAGIPINGTFKDATGGTGVFTGTFNPQSFGVNNGTLVLIGTLAGTLATILGPCSEQPPQAMLLFRSALQPDPHARFST